ncbi:histidine phosphatase superfamily [Trichophaea hybrida]|nr:histidine phosphatase superfamily [Trichophaea hybrida]
MLGSLALFALATQFAVVQSETIHGAVIFSRHGDRTWKGAPPTKLTALGQNQMYNSGSYWRSRYLTSSSPHQISGINSHIYSAAQFSASAPNQPLLVTSAQAFLQGLYPPTTSPDILANGTQVEPPLFGFQYATVTTILDDSPETIWLKGNDGCPVYAEATAKWNTTDSFVQLQKSTKDFYKSFYAPIFAGVLPESKMSYANAYTIFDYINVGVIHNSTIAKAVTSEDLFHLRTLADSSEWAKNTNTSDARTVQGRTLVNRILTQLQTVVADKGTNNKLSLFIGSYDTFLSLFSLLDLQKKTPDFYGLPDYASASSFELFSNSDSGFPAEKDLKVRFLFRNSTNSGVKEFSLVGRNALSWTDFKAVMEGIAVKSVGEWCLECNSEEAFCPQKISGTAATGNSNAGGRHWSMAVAGAVGAMATLVVFMIVGICAVAAGLRISRKRKAAADELPEKGPIVSV